MNPLPASAPPADASKGDASKASAKKDKKDKPKKEDKGNAKAPKGPKAPEPEFVSYRVKMWDELKNKQPKVEPKKILITLPDGKTIEGVAGQTTPLKIAADISKGLAEKTLISKVNGEMHDAWRPLTDDCKLELLDFESPEGKHTFWHSSSHLLGLALEVEYNANLCMGPPLDEGGFYYDCDMKEKVHPEDFKSLEDSVARLVSGKHDFERLVIKKEDGLEMFKHNPFKLEIIKNKIPDGGTCTVYRCGPFIDLCKGPHLPNTGKIKAMRVTKNAASYWLGKAENAPLQRVYGISFPKDDMLKKWEENMRLAAERDHRKIGTEQKLFFFHELSPGSCFFLPHGARVYNTLIEFMRREYRRRGFTEVISPNVFNVDLWKTSGHYENYKENMFLFDVENAEFGMKPMNCPGHCLMFKHQLHSYRDLPLRYADFGVLHRNEYSGALTGLTRVRRFQQDDAHIFCRKDQIKQEIAGALDFLQDVYGKFGFHFILNLSTRPEKFLGDVETWNNAEKALEECLNERFGKEWHLNPGDGAFYGPKIDIQLKDALERKHQCATIQLDFQLPSKDRFNLHYKTEAGNFETPVIIHRAILGSVERMMAVLIEHTGGKWPFWLSPRQAMVVPISPLYVDYARQVRQQLWDAGFFADVDDSSDQLAKKIRNAQMEQYNYILGVGEAEMKEGMVDVRTRDNQRHGTKKLDALIAEFLQKKADFQ